MCTTLLTRIHESESFTVLPEDINDNSMNDRSNTDTNLPAIASTKIKSIYHQNCIVPNEDFSILYNSISGKLQPQPLLSTGLLNKSLYSPSKDFFNKVSSKLRDLRPKLEVNEEEQKERKMDRPMFITTVKTGTFLEPPPEVAALLGLRKNSFGSNTASSNSSTGKTTQNVGCNRNVIYSFASKPRILKSDLQSNMASRSLFRSEVRREKREIPNELPKLSNETTDGGPQYGNTMFDRRVARGSNFASQRPNVTSTEHVLSRQAEARRRAAVRQRAQIRARKLRLGTPPPIDGRKHGQIQTDKYLEELTERPPDKSIACQADLPVEHDTPIHLYDSSTQVVEAETQIYPGDLPHTDDQLPSVVTSIVKKILHEAILEINEELEAIRLRNLASEKRFANSNQDGDNGVITKNELNDIVVQAIETVKKSEEFTSSDKNWNDIDNDRLLEKIFNEIKNTIKDVTFLADIIKKQMVNWSDFEINKETSPVENESNKDAEEDNTSNSGKNDNINETDLRKVSAPSINEESYSDDRESEEDNSDREDEGLAPMNAEIDDYRDKTDNFEDENEDSTDVKNVNNVINEDQNTTANDRENAENSEGSNFSSVTRTNSAVGNDRENQASPATPEAEDLIKRGTDDEGNTNERNKDESEDNMSNDESNSPELSNEIGNQETSEDQKQLSNESSNREISVDKQELSNESSNRDKSDDQQQLSNESINQDISDDKKESPVSIEEENVESITRDDTSKENNIKDENENMKVEESESNENAQNNITNANDNSDDENLNESIEEEHVNKRPDSSTDVMSQLDPPINDTNSSDDIIIEGNDNNKPIDDTSTTEINTQNERNSNLTNEKESDDDVINQEEPSENENTMKSTNNEKLENVNHDTITSEEISDQSAAQLDHAIDKNDSTSAINEEKTPKDSSHISNENELSSSNVESNEGNTNRDPDPDNQNPSDNISEQNDLSEQPNTSVTVDAESTSTNEDDNDVIAVKPTLESTLDSEVTNDMTTEGQPTSGVIPDEQQDSYINEMPDNSPMQTEEIKTDTIQENGTNETLEDNSTQKGNIENSTQELTKDKQSDAESLENNELQSSDENATKTNLDAESGNLSGKPEKSSESVSRSELKSQESVEENDIHDTSVSSPKPLNNENIVKTENNSNDEIIATPESQKGANDSDAISIEEITESDKRSTDLSNQSPNQTDDTDSQEKATSEVTNSAASQTRGDNTLENDDLSIKENSDTKNDTSETDPQPIESKVQETNNNDSNVESKNPTTVVRNGSVVTSR